MQNLPKDVFLYNLLRFCDLIDLAHVACVNKVFQNMIYCYDKKILRLSWPVPSLLLIPKYKCRYCKKISLINPVENDGYHPGCAVDALLTFARSYRILRFQDGLGGLRFSN